MPYGLDELLLASYLRKKSAELVNCETNDLEVPANADFVIRKTYPMQAYKIMHGLWGMGQMMFTKYIVVVDDECLRTATRRAQHQ